MIRTFSGKGPRVAVSSFVSETAYVVGDVEIGEEANIWPGAVIRGDIAKITIGKNVSIEDNCVVHSATDLSIGDNTIVGHGAVLHCRKIGHHVLIGNQATVLDNVEIGEYCVIGAGSVVAPGTKVAAESLVLGVPAQVKGEVSQEQKDYIDAGVVFNIKLAREYKKQGL
ncbi:MAG: gamma carbonic anhydrase family protein [Deltaproteobacteria bacterium]|nr:gamma carbonic anhydrase family protein [Deltaproteobacteria bacterium]